ncbi:conserved hypothetical protein [Planktothrix sp. PCC 11201]|uniref:DUF2283 domain-containing protein n=1 Tax=Planktothrix sp. PCC 11201 TaxID=1729650 RepID=UPI00091FAA0C|nr:DUF2283 domain-containing protein [Planktothrix sp. PCC 11201]SKB11202.1 conserved hypothetical protein [Planktothrix sp. PCC 11201]
MNPTKMTDFEQEDILHLKFSDEPETGSIEISPNFIRDVILESAQGKLLNFSSAKVS